jgi:probable lipoprotein NlpC
MNTRNLKYSFLFLSLIYMTSCSVFERLRNGKSSESSVPPKAREVIGNAREKLGTPYKYAGATPAGYDCSGLVFTSFQEAGITLPRTSGEQATVGKDVLMKDVRPGDLVFFATKKGEGKISHVGIVSELKDKEVVMFIHAANTGVQEDNLYSPYYFNSFVKAKRPY